MVEVRVSEEYGLMKPVFYSSQLTVFSLSERDLVYHEAERNTALTSTKHNTSELEPGHA